MKIRLSARHYLALLFVFVVVYGVFLFSLQDSINENRIRLNELDSEYAYLTEVSTARERELKYVQSDAGIELYAHVLGYKYADETRYTAVVNGTK